jgi:hypothetical protein
MKFASAWPGLLLVVGLVGGYWISTLSGQDAGAGSGSVLGTDASANDSSPLATLDWLVGSWEAETPKGKAEFSCRFTKNDAFLLRTFRIVANDGEESGASSSGMQIVGFDPAKQVMRSWTFDSNGGFGEDVWSQSGDTYTLRTTYTLPDGGVGASLNAMRFIDENSFRWRSSHREIDGEMQPDSDEVVFRRVAESDVEPQN